LVDTRDLKSLGFIGRAGSIPAPGTLFTKEIIIFFDPFINLYREYNYSHENRLLT
jgi:hypothetical protein